MIFAYLFLLSELCGEWIDSTDYCDPWSYFTIRNDGTCTVDGETVYTADFSHLEVADGVVLEAQSATEVLTAPGHDYKAATYTWGIDESNKVTIIDKTKSEIVVISIFLNTIKFTTKIAIKNVNIAA